MSIFSNFLKLFKYEPTADAQNTFNIQTALNDNWDKVDAFATDVSQQLEEKADIKKTITRQDWQEISGTLVNFIKTQITSSVVYGSLWVMSATDINNMRGYATWKSDTGATDTVFVELDDIMSKKKFYRTFYYSSATWIDSNWKEITTTEKIDISSCLKNNWTVVSGNELILRRSGNIVHISGAISGGAISVGTVLITLPDNLIIDQNSHSSVEEWDAALVLKKRIRYYKNARNINIDSNVPFVSGKTYVFDTIIPVREA